MGRGEPEDDGPWWSEDGEPLFSREDLPKVPDDVEFSFGSFQNADGLNLATYSWKPRLKKIKGIVWLCHGYASHTMFEWFLPSAPGQPHDTWEGSTLSLIVDAGFAVYTLDHQSHGRSEGLQGLRCYFESFDDLAQESLDCLGGVLADKAVAALPCFILGISMGGATAVRMAQLDEDIFTGVALYAPMFSLEQVKKKKIVCCITNGSLKPIVGCLNATIPTMPVGKPDRNTIHPKSQEEMDNDPLTWSGDVRVRVAKEFSEITDWFMDGGLEEMRVPFIVFHSVKDTFTDPGGSEALMEMAESTDKKFEKLGPGLDVDVDIWHSITTEPGSVVVAKRMVEWLNARV